jgi:hypothetical protein
MEENQSTCDITNFILSIHIFQVVREHHKAIHFHHNYALTENFHLVVEIIFERSDNLNKEDLPNTKCYHHQTLIDQLFCV